MSNTAEELKVTKGVFWANGKNGLLRIQPFPNYNHEYNNLDCDVVGRDEAYANATLYAEAHNFFNQNGIRPMEIKGLLSSKDKEIEDLKNRLLAAEKLIEENTRLMVMLRFPTEKEMNEQAKLNNAFLKNKR